MELNSMFFSLTLVLVVQCFLALGSAAPSYTTDQSALLALKSHLIYYPNHILASNWSTTTSICSWVGVSCRRDQSRVRSLDLSNMGLRGTIPPQIGNLSFLSYFNISNNDFTGDLPFELSQLHRLKVFDLHLNDFSGEFPSSIFNISSLQMIDFANNSLVGSLPDSLCHKLLKLTVLSLSWNKFFGDIPLSLGECRELQYLSLSGNWFTGFIPRGIGNLTMLKKFYLGPANLQGEIPSEIGNLQSLETLSFKLTNLHGSIPPSLFNMSSLKELRLSENNLFGSLPMDICSGLPHLETLSLRRNELTGSIPQQIGNCTSMIVLRLEEDKLSGVIPTEINKLQSMWYLSIAENNLMGRIPDTVFNMSRLELMIDVACALEYLHYGYSMPVVHCDLKPSNVLLDDDMIAHVSDFGIAKLLYGENIAQTKTLATIGYIAPEYGSKGLVSSKCDIYSFGIMVMETFTRKKPTDAMFEGDLSLKQWVDNSMPNRVTEFIDANLLRPNEEQYAAKVQCVSSIMELALKCSVESAEERLNMNDVLAALKKIKFHYLTNCRRT